MIPSEQVIEAAPYRVERVGLDPYRSPFSWGVIRAPEATFTAICATRNEARRVCDALNRQAIEGRDAPGWHHAS